jgi:HAD superfamily hydrolase (TIGR01509 family)
MDESLPIKLIVFDLDGVLVDSRELHYEALNRALERIDPKYVIHREEHLAKYDGRPTTVKLNMLTVEKGLPKEMHDKVWQLKQDLTIEVISDTFQYDERLRQILRGLKKQGYLLYCASNSIHNTIKMMLLRKGLLEYFDFFLSNEEIANPKPAPEIYLQCCIRANVSPRQTLILEDSHIGRRAALLSGAHLLPIETPDHVTYDLISNAIKHIDAKQGSKGIVTKWTRHTNIVIPMAGTAKRFAGYSFPKFLIDINGNPMIQVVTENLNMEGRFIFIVLREHYEKYNLNLVLNLLAPKCEIICTDKVTEGAAISALLAKHLINNDDPCVIANADQYLDWDSNAFMYAMNGPDVDGGILTFSSTHPRWSYCQVNDHGWVTEVAEKRPISHTATCGVYMWKKGSDFVKYAEQMVSKNTRVGGEFYVAPVYNEAITDGKKIKVFPCKKMWGLGVPEDIDIFLEAHKE